MKAVILAAGIGSRLAPLTDDRPKALVSVGGRSLLFRQLDHLAGIGIDSRDVVVVGGYRLDQLSSTLADAGYACSVVRNDKYEQWGNFYSVLVAEPVLRGHDFLQIDGDVVLDDKILPRMAAATSGIALSVDSAVELDDEAMKVQLRDGRLVAVSKQLDARACAGEYIGVFRVSAAGAPAYFRELAKLPDEGLAHEYYEHAVHRLAQRGEGDIGIVLVDDCRVLEIDDHADLERAEALLAKTA